MLESRRYGSCFVAATRGTGESAELPGGEPTIQPGNVLVFQYSHLEVTIDHKYKLQKYIYR
jgi:hypothetical protein